MTEQFLLGVAASAKLDTWSLISNASGVVIGVMSLLALMSIAGWYIIGYKYFFVARATRETEAFLDAFWRSKDIEQIYQHAQSLRRSPVSHMFVAGYSELAKLQRQASTDRDGDLENVERALTKAQTKEVTRLESNVSFLATTGSAAPFI